MQSELKILYLSVNSSFSHSSLAFYQLYSYTKEKVSGFKWDFHESTIKDNINETLKHILENNPDIFISTVYLFNRVFIFELIRKLKILKPEIKIILGGPEFLGNNEVILRNFSEIDAIFRGDESSFYIYLNSLHQVNTHKDEISGICYIDNYEKYKDNGIAGFSEENLDFLPSPFEHDFIKANKPFMQIETSRGCFSKCSFCTSALSKGVKFYSLNRVKCELQKLHKLGYREIRILDRTFNLPSKRAVSLLKLFSDEFSDMKFHLEFEPDKLTEEVLEQLSKSLKNQFHIEAGIQTLHKPSLEFISRCSNSENTLKKLKKLISLKNIDVHVDLIYGLPLQTFDSVINDLNTLILSGPSEIQIEVLKILPGTPIKNCLDKYCKYSPEPPYEVLETKEMCLERIIELSYLSKLIDSFYNQEELQKIIKYAVFINNNFLYEFLTFSKNYFSMPEKPSLKNRFKILLEYFCLKQNGVLKEFTLFTCCKMGFFDFAESRIELIKKDKLCLLDKKTKTTVYTDDKVLLEKPAYLITFSHNAGELWLDKNIEIKNEKSDYLFRLSQNGLSKTISKIEHVFL